MNKLEISPVLSSFMESNLFITRQGFIYRPCVTDTIENIRKLNNIINTEAIQVSFEEFRSVKIDDTLIITIFPEFNVLGIRSAGMMIGYYFELNCNTIYDWEDNTFCSFKLIKK